MMTIPGYALIDPICEAGDLVLYKATREKDGLPVLLKVPARPHPAPILLRRLEHEYELARDLDSVRIARPIALERRAGSVALILEQGPTRCLASLVGSPMDIQSFLRIALGITAALAELHRQGLIHKDLKPEHVLLDSTGHVWLTGLGVASRLTRERQAPDPPEVIAGTLAYMAPEQTGRMNRSVDSRSDLYALGVTFYQMLCGVLPFEADDPMEWVHCHIARQPVPLIERVSGIPEPLSEIVTKLLAKSAEERYQSSTGLDTDLRHCLAQWEANSRIDSFPIGTHDIPERLLVPERLYGRKSQIDALLAAFERVVVSGAPELVLVSGFSGIGKTSVVHELHKVLIPPRGLFAAGKFDQYKRDIPYATLVEALETLIHQILGKSEADVAVWRDAILQAVSPNGQLIVSLIPDLEFIIGKQPPVQDLPPQDAQNRFSTVFRRFLGVFARPEHPLALFLDDLQWLDAPTLEMLKYLMAHPEVKHLFLIGAYRSNEVSPSHPLMLSIDAIRRSGASVQEIVLTPLTREDVCRLVADTFHTSAESVGTLSQLVHEKTAGNPFFVIQFLSLLAEEGLITFDRRAAAWQWDIERIRAQRITDNVADLMVEKLYRLSESSREALKHLACLGNRADATTLSLILNMSEEGVDSDLWTAVQLGLVQCIVGSYVFLHDRVQEAAYMLIPKVARAAMHLQIGQRLLSHLAPAEREENLFDIVNQLNRGSVLLTDPSEKRELADLNIIAGKKARASIAYEPARNFFSAAAAQLPETWDSLYEVKFPLFLDWAECEYLCGEFEHAETLFEVLLAQATTDFDRALVYELRLKVYHVAGKYDAAVAMGLKALQLFGVEIPEDEQSLQQATQAEAAAVKANLGGRKIADLVDAPAATDPSAQATIGLLSNVAPAAYIGSHPEIFPLIILKLVNTSLKFGHTNESCMGYSAYGFMLVSLFNDPHTAYEFSEMSIKLNQKLGDISRRGTVLHLHGDHINFWLHHISSDFPILERGFTACIDAGDLVFANFIAFETVWQAVERGDTLGDVLELSKKYADFSRGCRNEAVYLTICLEQQFVKSLMGRTKAPTSFEEDSFEEAPCVKKIADATFTCGIVFYHMMKLITAYLLGDEEASLVHAAEAKKTLAAAMAMPMEATFHFIHALVLTRSFRHTSEQQRGEILSTLREYEQKLSLWAENCPENFAGKHALASAEIARITGDELAAEHLYEQAIQSARANGFPHWEAMANEAAALFHHARGFASISTMYLRQARHCYLRWGATTKVQQLDKQFPQIVDRSALTSAMTSDVQMKNLDVLAVVAASQALSGEILLDNLLKILMRIVLENAGAQKGYLILSQKEELMLATEARVDRQRVIVQIHSDPGFPEALFPVSILNYVHRSQDKVLLDDATGPNPYSGDEFFSRQHPKSVLCLPIVKQNKLIGLLYLENDLATHAFTPDRIAVLEVLAAQAANSLETARMYENLRLNELRFRLGQTAARIGTWEYDLKSTRFWGSDEAKRIYGFDVEDPDFSTERVENCIPGREWVHQALIDLVEKGVPYNLEFEVRPVDGSAPRFISSIAELYRDLQDTPVKVVGVIQDITERKQTEEDNAWNLAINQTLSSLYIPLVTTGTSIVQIADAVLDKCRELTSSAHGYVAEIDPDNGDLIAHTNTKMMQTECAIVEEELRKIRFPKRADGLYNALWGHALNIREPFYTDEPVKHPASVGIPKGHIAIERFLTVPVLLSGELVGQIALSNSTRAYTDRDLDAIKRISEFYALAIQHKRAEDELRAHRDHLEEMVKQRAVELTIARDVAEKARHLAEAANKAKSIFLANISHELRTPLNAILGYSQLMQRDTSLLPEQQDYLNTINRSGEHLLALINDVLEISKIEAGQISLDAAPFDLRALLGDMEEMFRVRTDAKSLRLDFIGINEVPRYLETDENKLRQILINVLGNAVKFTQRGSVTLRIDIKRMGHGPESKEKRGSGAQCLCFEVEDSGVGIAEEELDKVFAPFGQTESGRMSRTGTGLGMAITQSYVRLMGGDISVVSTPGRGSIFRFDIAVSEVSQADIKEQTRVQRRVVGLQPDQVIPRILVVEDMEESRAMLVKLLGIVGFHVREALNGKQAIEKFRQWQPNFIWMDIRMPVMDGLEATRHIKQSDAGKSTVIAALTAHALEEEREEILAAGCDDVVRKPLREHDIFDVMKKHLGLKYLYEEAGEETSPAKSKVEIGPEQLAALPANLLSQLYQAALELNEQQSLALIEKIKPIDADIARKLEVLVRNFAYDSLQDLLKRGEHILPEDTHD